MTDPAEAAAKRALPDNTFDPGCDVYSATALAAAREMAQPIRDLIECCEEFGDELDIDDLKKLVYTEWELS